MDEGTLNRLDQARERIIAALASARGHTAIDRAVYAAQRAFAQVLPRLPGMIESRIGDADARIYRAAEVRRLLVDFAIELLAIQTSDLIREAEVARRAQGDR